MIYLFEIEDAHDLKLSVRKEDDLVCITIMDILGKKEVWIGKEDLYDLIGILHIIQKQINQ